MNPLLLKALPYIAGLLLLVAAAAAVDRHRHKVDTNEFQAEWQARDLADAKAVAGETARQQAAEAAHKALDAQVLDEYKNQVASALAANGDLAHRLRLATAAHDHCAVSASPPATGGTNGTGAGNGSDGALESATQAVFAACIDAAARLSALQRDLAKPLQ